MKNYKWLYLTILGTALCLISVVLRYLRKKKQEPAIDLEMQDNEISSTKTLVLRIPKFYRGIALLVPLVCIFLSIWIIIPIISARKELLELMWLVPLWMMGAPFVGIFICWSLWKVEASKDGFTYRNWFGKGRVYKFEDLTYKCADSCIKWWFLKDGKKVICLAYYIEGENKLLKRYNKCMSRLRNERNKVKAN